MGSAVYHLRELGKGVMGADNHCFGHVLTKPRQQLEMVYGAHGCVQRREAVHADREIVCKGKAPHTTGKRDQHAEERVVAYNEQ